MAEHYEVGGHDRPDTTPGERISYVAGKATVYDPSDPRYWDEALLKEEVERAFEISKARLSFAGAGSDRFVPKREERNAVGRDRGRADAGELSADSVVDGCDFREREIREGRRERRRPEFGGWASELCPSTDVADVGRGEDGNAPGARDPTADPKSTAFVEAKMDPRLDVDLIATQRAVVDGAARVADHFGADTVDGR